MKNEKDNEYNDLLETVWYAYDSQKEDKLPPRRVKSLLGDLLSKVQTQSKCKVTLKKICNDMDINKDGTIDKDEFITSFHKNLN